MNLGVSVHMGTFGVLWASGGGYNPIADSEDSDFEAQNAENRTMNINEHFFCPLIT